MSSTLNAHRDGGRIRLHPHKLKMTVEVFLFSRPLWKCHLLNSTEMFTCPPAKAALMSAVAGETHEAGRKMKKNKGGEMKEECYCSTHLSTQLIAGSAASAPASLPTFSFPLNDDSSRWRACASMERGRHWMCCIHTHSTLISEQMEKDTHTQTHSCAHY